jgi:glycosidase
MPWDSRKPNAGFSKNPKVYIPIGKLPQGMSVQDQEADPDSLLNWVKAMLTFKKEHPALDNDASVAFLLPSILLLWPGKWRCLLPALF